MIRSFLQTLIGVIAIAAFFSFGSCNFTNTDVEEENIPGKSWDTLKVTVSAFNSLHYQTTATQPDVAAWGDTLSPGMNAVAISRDLIALGLDRNDTIRIQGFDSIYKVKDKMHHRWKKRVDIYMGEDVKRAKRFGKKKLEIYYQITKDTASTNGENRIRKKEQGDIADN